MRKTFLAGSQHFRQEADIMYSSPTKKFQFPLNQYTAYDVAKTYPFNPQFQTQVLPYTRDRNGNDAQVAQQHVIVQTVELAGVPDQQNGFPTL